MPERCANCKYFHKLKHNFAKGKGFQITSCCIILTQIGEDCDNYDSFVIEVNEDSKCEMYTEAGN